jgi:hypothetical protein
MTRESRAFGAHPDFERGDERRHAGAANSQAFVGGLHLYAALDIEESAPNYGKLTIST